MKRQKIILKISSIALATALLLGACTEAKETVVTPNKQTENVTRTDTEQQTEDALTPTQHEPSDDEEPATVKEPPEVTTDSCRGEKYADDGTTIVEGYYENPALTDAEVNENYKDLRIALEKWALEQDELFWQTMDSYDKNARELLDTLGTNFFTTYSIDRKVEYTRVDNTVVSLRVLFSDYMGGAHGNYGYGGITFDAASGERLSLPDLMTDDAAMEQFCNVAADYCVANVEEQDLELNDYYESCIRSKLSFGDETQNWYLEAAGITIVCNPYEIAPYYIGPVFITIPYEKVEQFMKPQYCGIQESGAAMLSLNVEAAIPLHGQDGTMPVTVNMEGTPYDGTSAAVVVSVGEHTEKLSGLEYVCGAYIVRRADGSMLLFCDVDIASDDYTTLVYEISSEGIRINADYYAGIDRGSVNADSIKLIHRIDVLGTRSVEKEYKIDEDGNLISVSDWFEFVSNSYCPVITAVRQIPVVIDGTNTFLPAGSRFKLLGTNGVDTVRFFEMNSGTEGDIYYTRDEESGIIYIDGAEEYEYFESLPYAG